MPSKRENKPAAGRSPTKWRPNVAARAPHLVDLALSLFGPKHGIDLVLPARPSAEAARFEVTHRRRRPA